MKHILEVIIFSNQAKIIYGRQLFNRFKVFRSSNWARWTVIDVHLYLSSFFWTLMSRLSFFMHTGNPLKHRLKNLSNSRLSRSMKSRNIRFWTMTLFFLLSLKNCSTQSHKCSYSYRQKHKHAHTLIPYST